MALARRTGPSLTHPDDSAALAHKMMSGLPIPDFRGGWGVSLSGGFPGQAHFWLRATIDARTVSICGRATHRNLYNPDGSICAGMADPGDWTRCRLCEGLR